MPLYFKNQAIKKVIFVCTANTCRSPVAEFLFRDIVTKNLGQESSEYEISSAGIYAYPNDTASYESSMLLKNYYNLKLDNFRSQAINPYMFNKDTLFVAMTIKHKEALEKLKENLTLPDANIITFSDISHTAKDISDPYASGLNAYENMIKQVEEYCYLLFDYLYKNEINLN